MNGPDMQPRSPWRIDLMEVAAIVVGYGLAALLFRAFWPRAGVSLALAVFAIGFYLWLGLAMSGPLLLLRQRTPVQAAGGEQPSVPRRAGSRTWAEIAWLLIGVYWIVMGLFILPIRMQSFRFGDTVLFGLVPVAAALVFRLFGPRSTPEIRAAASWTHHAAVGLLATWPIAWFCLIVLGRTML